MPIDHDTLLRILLSERAKVLAYIRAIARRRDLAEDVFQDVCVLALEKREQIVDAQHLAAWLRTAARLRTMNLLRQRQNRQASLDDSVLDLLEADWARHDAASPGSDVAEALESCMAGLTDKARAVLRLRYTDGLEVSEIARRSGRPVNSMYVTFSRIHSALADCVFRHLPARGGGARA